MKNKKHISKKFFYRLLLFVAVIAAASLFDHFNKNENFSKEETKDSAATKSVDLGQYLYYNPVKSSDLNRVNKDSKRNLFLRVQAKFLQQHHKTRTLYFAKSERAKSSPSDFLTIHKVLIKQIHYTDPDDSPPLS